MEAGKALTAAGALDITRRLVEDRYPEADFAFVAGSIMRGTATPSSDIDIVVVNASLPFAWRESFLYDGVPVEAFVHDDATLAWFMDADVKAGRPVLIRMVAEGVAIGPKPGKVGALRQKAEALLRAGPPVLDPATLDRMRYGISDMLTDLRDKRPASEILAIGAALYSALGDFILRSNGAWLGAGKWLPRQIIELDEALGCEFVSAFDVLFRQGKVVSVLEFADKVLAPHGGLLFGGYRQDAPAAWRMDLRQI